MAQGTLMPWVKSQWFTDNGEPCAGYQLFSYSSGSSNKLSTYSEVTLTTPNSNPTILDSAGRAVCYLTPGASYKFELATPLDTDPPSSPIWSQDNVASIPSSATATDVQAQAGTAIVAGDAVYLSDGSGGQQVGRWYPTDADVYFSGAGAKVVGFALANQLNNGILSVRTAGRMTGLSSLTTGAAYYLSGTAGGITTTVPAFGTSLRLIGIADTVSTLILAEKPKAQTRERVYSQIVSVGNVGAGEDTLAEYIAPAGELSLDHMRYEIEAWGNTVSNANAKTLRLRVIEGANNTVLMAFALTAAEAGHWRLSATVIRSLFTNAKAVTEAKVGPANGPVSRTWTNVVSTIPVTSFVTNAVTYRITGDATTTGDIALEGAAISLLD